MPLTTGRTSSVELVDAYVARIRAYDHAGPVLNAVIRLNPNARSDATALDRERGERGARGPLHGIPVLVKDNYEVSGLTTSAGTVALAGWIPDQDAAVVRRPPGGWRGNSRHDQHARARPRHHNHRVDRRTDSEPLRSQAQSWRLERRNGRRDRVQLRRDRMGQRHMRLDPDPCGTPEHVRASSDLRHVQHRGDRSPCPFAGRFLARSRGPPWTSPSASTPRSVQRA